MSIMASTLYHDMLNFFRNQFGNILLLILLISLISIVLSSILLPGHEQLMLLGKSAVMSNHSSMNLKQIIDQLSVEQQIILLKIFTAGTVANLVGNVLLSGGLLTMIHLVSNRQSASVLRSIWLSVPVLPRLSLLIFFTTLLIQLGLLLLIPGILLAIAFSLAPVIATIDNFGVIKSMQLSAKLVYANIRLIAPAILFWLSTKAALLLLTMQLTTNSILAVAVLLNGLSHLIYSLLLIYLYRLYMLLYQS